MHRNRVLLAVLLTAASLALLALTSRVGLTAAFAPATTVSAFTFTSPAEGAIVPCGQPITVTWTGGNPSDNVNLTLIDAQAFQVFQGFGIEPNTGSRVVTIGPGSCGRQSLFYLEDSPRTTWTYGPTFMVAPANAGTTMLGVPSSAGPWLHNLNPNFDYGVHDNTAPVVVDGSNAIPFTAGNNLTVTYFSGLVQAGEGYPFNDANGLPGYVRNYCENFGCFPAVYMNPNTDLLAMELVGTFANDGVIVGNPFPIGNGPSVLTVPAGANQLLLGVNDTRYADNSGFLTVAVSSASPCSNPTWQGFNTALNYGTSQAPVPIATGDFNQDGRLDLAVGNADVATLSILLGNASGFAPATNIALGAAPYAIATADFNADGKPDLAVAGRGANSILLLLGNGAGGFSAPTSFAVGSKPQSVAVGDFNNDGKLDVVAGNFGSNNISVLLGDGAGGFGAATNFAVGTTPFSVAVADFNSDGKLDLAVANHNSNDVSILIGNGAGSFGGPTNFAAGTNPNSVVAADFNNDGKIDLAVAESNVSVLLGNGSGGFGPATSFPAGSIPVSITASDLNTDGSMDLQVVNFGDNNTSVVLGNGSGSFGAVTNFSVGSGPGSGVAGDFNNDGKIDLAVTNSNSDTVSILLNAGATCAPSTPTPTPTPAPGASVVVTNTNDSGAGSLRQAILDTNSAPGAQNISFNIPGPGVHTISPTSPLPQISDALVIDGYTQPGTSPNTLATGDNAVLLIEINGTNAGANIIGLQFTGGNSRVRGLVINRFNAAAIRFDGNGNTAEGNFLGTSADGNSALGNRTGVSIFSSNNLIGGQTPAARNIISGNNSGIFLLTVAASSNQVQGNYIGTNASGLAALANGNGVSLGGGPNNLIGGLTSGAGNVISGNGTGILIQNPDSSGNQIQGNFIGTDVNGTAALRNGGNGIFIINAPNNVIGGATAGSRNIISGNGRDGILIASAGSDTVQGNYIGTDVTGTVAIGNDNGVNVSANAVAIGGTASGAGNLISGNRLSGIQIFGDVTGTNGNNNTIQGNYIGTDQSGSVGVPNQQSGIIINRAANNLVGGQAIGVTNKIAFNNGAGVSVLNTNGNRIMSNSIVANSGPGIELSNANNNQPAPVLNSVGLMDPSIGAVNFQGTVNSTPNTTATVQFFANDSCDPSGSGEGQALIGGVMVMTDAAGLGTFNITLASTLIISQVVTATATDANNNTSAFSVCHLVATRTSTALRSSLNPANIGQAVTFNATVTGNGVPTGTVEFFDGGQSMGTANLASGSASLTTTTLTAGAHSITATYSGDATHLPSTSTVVDETVRYSTTTSLTSSLNPSVFGQTVTFTASVTSGGSSATGFVEFFDYTQSLGVFSLPASRVVSFTTSALTAGSHSITAVYGGSGSFSGSTSPGLIQTIGAVTPVGSNVNIQETAGANSINISFTDVNVPGTTTITPIDPTSAGAVPGGFTVGGLAFDLDTTASFVGPVNVCFQMPSVTDPAAFSKLRILHSTPKLDVATTNYLAGSLSTLLGNGSGGFGGQFTSSAGYSASRVATGDFNGDGKQDLAVILVQYDVIRIFLGNGAGNFMIASTINTGSNPTAVAAGDLNSDGKIDLAVVNGWSSNISILLGDGAGQFVQTTSAKIGILPYAIAIGDFNADKKPDLVVANHNSATISLLLGNGTGSFASATTFQVAGTPGSIAVGDFNGDGKLDVVTANGSSPTISLLLGNGTGGFSAARNFAAVGVPSAIAVADFNNDRKLDLSVLDGRSNNAYVLLGTGTGSFGSPVGFAMGTSPGSIVAADFNNDGKVDLATANTGSNNLSIRLNLGGSPSFSAAANYPVGAAPFALAVANFNNDVVVKDQTILSGPNAPNFTTKTICAQVLSFSPFIIASVDDATPPTISNVSVDPTVIWPPEHQMIDITVNYDLADDFTAPNAIVSTLEVSCNEPVNITGDGNTEADIEIVDAHHVRLRAERSGDGSGRIYAITITSMDSAQNRSTRTVTVSVPKAAS